MLPKRGVARWLVACRSEAPGSPLPVRIDGGNGGAGSRGWLPSYLPVECDPRGGT